MLGGGGGGGGVACRTDDAVVEVTGDVVASRAEPIATPPADALLEEPVEEGIPIRGDVGTSLAPGVRGRSGRRKGAGGVGALLLDGCGGGPCGCVLVSWCAPSRPVTWVLPPLSGGCWDCTDRPELGPSVRNAMIYLPAPLRREAPAGCHAWRHRRRLRVSWGRRKARAPRPRRSS